MIHDVPVRVYYPKWKTWAMTAEPPPVARLERIVDDEQPIKTNFHRIFVCRSGGWTPPWLDDKFDKFIEACPVKEKINLDDVKNRQFNQAQMDHEVANQRSIQTMLEKANNP